MGGQKDGPELLVEIPPVIGQVGGQVLVNLIVGADEALVMTEGRVDAFRAQHDAVVVFHKLVIAIRLGSNADLPLGLA